MIDARVTNPAQKPATVRTRDAVVGTDLAALRGQLEQQRTLRVRQLEELAAATHCDSAAEGAKHQVALYLAEAASGVLVEIDAALDRFARGHYGRCQRCGAGVPSVRLQALPMARHCMSRQSHQQLSSATQEAHPGRREQAALDLVEEWGRGSFPASDPPANW